MLKIDRTVRVIVHFCGEEVFSGTEAEYANWRKMHDVSGLIWVRGVGWVFCRKPADSAACGFRQGY